ncbi:hypothetical protein FQN53_008844 [Emmonsiellopsis sp. PD_33]|nr:hypothetical protein FQN53_008844 [Emmonsiellopsis sp. PD_33]
MSSRTTHRLGPIVSHPVPQSRLYLSSTRFAHISGRRLLSFRSPRRSNVSLLSIDALRRRPAFIGDTDGLRCPRKNEDSLRARCVRGYSTEAVPETTAPEEGTDELVSQIPDENAKPTSEPSSELVDESTEPTSEPSSGLVDESTDPTWQLPSGMLDVYQFATEYNLVPFTDYALHDDCPDPNARVAFMISLNELGIHVEGVGPTLLLACRDAAMRFKKNILEYEQSNPVPRRAYFLNPHNATKFLTFCRERKVEEKIGIISKKRVRRREGLVDGWVVRRVKPTLAGKTLCSPIIRCHNAWKPTLEIATAVALRQQFPDIWKKFLDYMEKKGEYVSFLNPVPFNLNEDALDTMRDALQDARRLGLPDVRTDPRPDLDPVYEYRNRGRFAKGALRDGIYRSRRHKQALRLLRTDPLVALIRENARKLPAFQHRRKILNTISSQPYSIIRSATGSGKSTQIPQIVFENAVDNGTGAYCNIIVTQPRRIAATSLARRVAMERNERLGQTVGYHIGNDCLAPDLTGGITYCTTQVLLNQLQHAPDEVLGTVSHLFIDEVHERDISIDFLLVVLRRAMESRLKRRLPVPRVVLLSATIDKEIFSRYFKVRTFHRQSMPCPTLDIPGRAYPVAEHFLENIIQTFREKYTLDELGPFLTGNNTTEYLEDERILYLADPSIKKTVRRKKSEVESPRARVEALAEEKPAVPTELAAFTIAHIVNTTEEGAILVFLPGWGSIKDVDKTLRETMPLDFDFTDEEKFKIIKLHSTLPEGQQTVFEPVPKGCRKIILSTDIAETSITLPDVQYVVDTGKTNEMIYFPDTRIRKLATCWASRSNIGQRAGRAGRVRNGNYFALFTETRRQSLRSGPVPELLRSDLGGVCIRAKLMNVDSIHDFLAQAIEPPPVSHVTAAIENLQAIGALDTDQNLTSLGRLLATLPLDPPLGKMVILGVLFRCLEPVLINACCPGVADLFYFSTSAQKDKVKGILKQFAGGSNSDHMVIVNAFLAVRDVLDRLGENAAREFCGQNQISFRAFMRIFLLTRQLVGMLTVSRIIQDLGSHPTILGGRELNTHSTNQELVTAVLLSGMQSNIVVRGKGSPKGSPNGWFTTGRRSLRVSPWSVNFSSSAGKAKLMVFSELRQNSFQDLLLATSSFISPLVACLFGAKVRAQGDILHVNDWLQLRVRVPNSTPESREINQRIVVEYKKALDRFMGLAFQDIAMARENPPEQGTPNKHLFTDDPLRDVFLFNLDRTLALLPQS